MSPQSAQGNPPPEGTAPEQAEPRKVFAPFDIRDALPTGTVVLEASAGTGKTYTVGALVTRYVAEGIASLDQLLVVTFGRAASEELRERVRKQLFDAERALADPEIAAASDDPLIVLLAAADVEQRRSRLARALADFDAATIVTTHQFCQQVLTGLGVAGDSEPDAVLVDDLDDLLVEVVDDLYLRVFGISGASEPEFDRAAALELARAATRDPQAALEPADAAKGTPAARRVGFATAIRKEMDRRKRSRGWMSYDDLLSRLAAALKPEGAPARERMRSRWQIVLVDEFQDTDPVQWDVLRLAFAGVATLVLIGDPKQAIYAFRGGDVVTYLHAASSADDHSTLSQNHRSDADLVDTLQVLMGGAALGEPAIQVRPVTAVHGPGRLTGVPNTAPVRLRVVRRDQLGVQKTRKIPMSVIRPHVARDLTADIGALLAAGARFGDRELVPADVAVLVSTHLQAILIRDCLGQFGIPAVIAGGASVYDTSAASDWTTLLRAMERPANGSLARAAALTSFLGRTAAELANAGAELTDELTDIMRGWSDVLVTRGPAAVLEIATADQALGSRLLRRPDGERLLTDLRHLGQEMQAASRSLTSPGALRQWLRRRKQESSFDRNTDRTRRLDSDAAAVQVLTLHASKGMQYPVVYLPFLFDRWERPEKTPLFHDAAGRRVLDVGGEETIGRRDRERAASAELAGESLRLLYVGLTRAQSQVVAWWAPTSNTPAAALHRLIFGRRQGESTVPDTAALPSDDEAARIFGELEARGGPRIEVSNGVPESLEVALHHRSQVFGIDRFDRDLDLDWRRSSFTSLTAGAEHAMVGSEQEAAEVSDEQVPFLAAGPGPLDPLRSVLSPMSAMPSGTDFGTLVHAVLENADPHAEDLESELRLLSEEQLRRHPLSVSSEDLAAALQKVIRSPLGPVGGGVRLADIPLRDRLAEMEFELPLAGGDNPTARLALGQLAPLLRRHLSAADPLAGYAARLESAELRDQPLRGYLTGSLDVVLRLPGPRYVVADYKTNWLGDPEEPELSAWHYRPAATERAMAESDYPLQALLYSVALHRYLRWRQPGYQPAEHLGGVLYLFVRGMTGPETPLVEGLPCGVFGWSPPAELVIDLSDLLDRGPA